MKLDNNQNEFSPHTKSKRFALIGVGGYIAPRHLKAIKDTGNTLIGAMDPHDSVGILDSFFPEVSFFKEFERFDRFAEKLRREGDDQAIEYVSICSPNYLHDAHIRFALRIGANTICEKPLVLNPWNVDALRELEYESGCRVNTVLQLRVHPALKALRDSLNQDPSNKKHEINLTYCTSRGPWYLFSWKGDEDESGGLATNIGVHFFDMLIWLFGNVVGQEVHISNQTKTAGYLELERAKVKWFLSIDRNDLPKHAVEAGMSTYRSVTIDGKEIEFSGGFTDLHTEIYKETLAGRGFGLEEARPAIQLAHDIRHAIPVGVTAHSHPFVQSN